MLHVCEVTTLGSRTKYDQLGALGANQNAGACAVGKLVLRPSWGPSEDPPTCASVESHKHEAGQLFHVGMTCTALVVSYLNGRASTEAVLCHDFTCQETGNSQGMSRRCRALDRSGLAVSLNRASRGRGQDERRED